MTAQVLFLMFFPKKTRTLVPLSGTYFTRFKTVIAGDIL